MARFFFVSLFLLFNLNYALGEEAVVANHEGPSPIWKHVPEDWEVTQLGPKDLVYYLCDFKAPAGNRHIFLTITPSHQNGQLTGRYDVKYVDWSTIGFMNMERKNVAAFQVRTKTKPDSWIHIPLMASGEGDRFVGEGETDMIVLVRPGAEAGTANVRLFGSEGPSNYVCQVHALTGRDKNSLAHSPSN